MDGATERRRPSDVPRPAQAPGGKCRSGMWPCSAGLLGSSPPSPHSEWPQRPGLCSPKGCSAEPPWEVIERGGSVPLLCPETGSQPLQNHTVLLEGVVKVKIRTTLPLCNSISQARNWLGLLYTFLPFQRKPRYQFRNLEIPEQALKKRPRSLLSSEGGPVSLHQPHDL